MNHHRSVEELWGLEIFTHPSALLPLFGLVCVLGYIVGRRLSEMMSRTCLPRPTRIRLATAGALAVAGLPIAALAALAAGFAAPPDSGYWVAILMWLAFLNTMALAWAATYAALDPVDRKVLGRGTVGLCLVFTVSGDVSMFVVATSMLHTHSPPSARLVYSIAELGTMISLGAASFLNISAGTNLVDVYRQRMASPTQRAAEAKNDVVGNEGR